MPKCARDADNAPMLSEYKTMGHRASEQETGFRPRDMYQALLAQAPDAKHLAADFLKTQLDEAARLPCDLPSEPAALLDWAREQALATSRKYQHYLEQRRSGAPRQYFAGPAQALWFLQAVAPTKLVDGAWLAAVTRHWQDERYRPLIQTYVEELGDGVQAQNHVAVYQRLLDASGCDQRDDLPDAYYVQGAIQLALAAHGDAFMPEVIGFNLGYEQLPLHLMMTAYELDELGIDPWYFTLHLTIDNAATGHAEKAVRAVLALAPQTGDGAQFWQRVRNGYRLNSLGAGSEQIIGDFHLEHELLAALERKARLGAFMHADRCRVGGKTVTQWLSQPGSMGEFLRAMEKLGWIQRGRPVQESRFWNLLHGAGAPMFGVFNGYEQQLLREWIEGEAATQQSPPQSWRRKQALQARVPAATSQHDGRPRPVLRDRFSRRRQASPADDCELRQLEEILLQCEDRQALFDILLPLLQPGQHHRAAGLMATRIYKQLLA